MNKKTFLKSIASGIIGLTIVASCSSHKDIAKNTPVETCIATAENPHKCCPNGCKANKEVGDTSTKAEANSCKTTKDGAHKCSANKCSANKCSANKCSAKK